MFNNRSYKSFNCLWNGPWWKAEYKITRTLSHLLAKRKPTFLGKWGLPKNNLCCQKVSHHLYIWFSSFWKYATPYKGKWKQLPNTVNPHFTQKIKLFSKSSKKKKKSKLNCGINVGVTVANTNYLELEHLKLLYKHLWNNLQEFIANLGHTVFAHKIVLKVQLKLQNNRCSFGTQNPSFRNFCLKWICLLFKNSLQARSKH